MLTSRKSFDSSGQEPRRLIGIRCDGKLAFIPDLLRPFNIEPFGKVEEHPALTFGAAHEPETLFQRLNRALLASLVRNLKKTRLDVTHL